MDAYRNANNFLFCIFIQSDQTSDSLIRSKPYRDGISIYCTVLCAFEHAFKKILPDVILHPTLLKETLPLPTRGSITKLRTLALFL